MKTIKIIKFGAEWCASCKATDATFRAFAEAHPEIETEIIDADKDNGKVEKLKIKSLPTLVFFVDGEEKMRRTGGFSSDNLELWLKSVD